MKWVTPAQASEFVGEGKGSLTNSSLTLRSVATVPKGSGTVVTVQPADGYRGTRVKLSGEIKTSGVTGTGASLWLRVDGATGQLILDNGTDKSVKGESDWVERSVVLPVAQEAKSLVFGALLIGPGRMEVRNLRLESLPASANVKPTGAAKLELDTVIKLVRTGSVWRDTVTWDKVLPQVEQLALGATTAADVYPAIRFLLSRLGDHHSFLMTPQATSTNLSPTKTNPPAKVQSLEGDIGYIAIYAYSGGAQSAAFEYAKAAHSGIAAVAPRARCGWIVDLRGNGGGNMYPMLGGLKPFLGNGTLGFFVAPGNNRTPWSANANAPEDASPELDKLESAYVAVLTGPRTASSGEAVTLSFKGRNHTRSFGSPTTGLSTGNATIRLPSGATLVLTAVIEADRTGKLYGYKIDPDEVVPGDNNADSMSDATVAAATTWLRSQGGCAGK